MLDALSGTLEGGAPMLSETIGCWVQESEVADAPAPAPRRRTRHCQIGSYPFWREGRAGANFVIRSTDADELAACARARGGRARGAGAPHHHGRDLTVRPQLPLFAVGLATAAASAGAAQPAAAPAPLPPATIDAFEQLLASEDSATEALADWCRTRGLAAEPVITARRLADTAPLPDGARALLGIAPDEPVAFRHVLLVCGNLVLSDARNWYLPRRLTPAMNRTLDSTDRPFGAVIAPLQVPARSARQPPRRRAGLSRADDPRPTAR